MEEVEISPAAARRILLQRLESLQRAGVEQIGRRQVRLLTAAPLDETPAVAVASAAAAIHTEADTQPPLVSTPAPPAEMPRTKSPPPVLANTALAEPYPLAAASAATRQSLLGELDVKVRGCTLCRELACTRTQTVFGIGNIQPRVVFFGEAPGADEDRLGEPFVGRAGQLLTKIIEACGWQRSDVYIMNVLKCRPPDNRNPSPSETANCRQYFERQFEILQPEYIVCVGTIPAQALLQTIEPVGKLRGRFHQYRDSTVLVTYHPSYLLRNPSAKKFVWDDMQMLLKQMGLPIPGKSA
jgi:uracil-DNA glycosylase family 4